MSSDSSRSTLVGVEPLRSTPADQFGWRVISESQSQLGESPFWHPIEHRLYWVDIAGRCVYRCREDGSDREQWVMPSDPGCIAPALAGGVVIGLRSGLFRGRTWGGELHLIVRLDYDPSVMRINDGKVDPSGRLWVGTLYEPRTAPLASLLCIDCRPTNGSSGRPQVVEMASGATVANGLAWSPDTKTVYWADTPSHMIRAWSWDGTSRPLGTPRVLRQFDGGFPSTEDRGRRYEGRPDGAAVDQEGNYWVAMYEGQQVLKISPSGEILERLPVPCLCPTMPCFGGVDGDTMFLTTSRHDRDPGELEQYVASGQIFARRVQSKGLPTNFFVD